MAANETFATAEAEIRPSLSIDALAPYEVCAPNCSSSPLVNASPHSGRVYPPDLMRLAALDAATIRTSEDALVDDLIAAAPRVGAPLIKATFARAYVDVNREPYELDPGMFIGDLPVYATRGTARVAAGLGSIARVVGEGREIYRSKLPVAEALERIGRVHRPYHEALGGLIEAALERHDLAVLLDWHSMPSASVSGYAARLAPDVVLGDRFGASCAHLLIDVVEHEFQKRGYRVARNAPYAGGYTTEHYGRPARGVHALQVELNRGLYLDEGTIHPSAGFAALASDLEEILRVLAASAWADLKDLEPHVRRRASL
jgi:N-formylglutamate amidohydrolase